MFKQIILLLTFVFFSTAGHSIDLSVDENGIIKNFPACIVDDTPVKYFASRRYVWMSRVSVAVSDMRKGQRIVAYDPYAFGDAPPEFQVWVLEHECFHHRAKHVGSKHGFSPTKRLKDESDSDRYATKKVIEYGFTDKQLDTIHSVVLNTEFINKHSPRHIRQVRRSMGLGKVDDQVRARLFKQYVVEFQK